MRFVLSIGVILLATLGIDAACGTGNGLFGGRVIRREPPLSRTVVRVKVAAPQQVFVPVAPAAKARRRLRLPRPSGRLNRFRRDVSVTPSPANATVPSSQRKGRKCKPERVRFDPVQTPAMGEVPGP